MVTYMQVTPVEVLVKGWSAAATAVKRNKLQPATHDQHQHSVGQRCCCGQVQYVFSLISRFELGHVITSQSSQTIAKRQDARRSSSRP